LLLPLVVFPATHLLKWIAWLIYKFIFSFYKYQK